MNPLLQMYIALRFIIDYIVDFIFGLFLNGTRYAISKPKNKLVLQSATSLARKIRRKEVTSEEVVKAFIERIKEVNPALNAVVDDRFEEALKEAQQIDTDIKSGKIVEDDFKRKPFLGVPFTTKESTVCKGLNVSFGLLARKYEFGGEDSKVVELMKNAGGILLGVTNIPQLNRWCECYNPVYGVTNNPYNTSKNVGGSSGGEACIIAARGSPIGIGTDIAGSLRIPSFRCGVFGHKPSHDLISTAGLTFRTGAENPTMVTAGPMSAHSEDLIPLLKILLDDNVNKLRLDEEVNVKKIKIYYMTESSCLRASPIPSSMKKVILKCVDHFNSFSEAKPKEVNFEDVKYGLQLWMQMLTKEKDNFLKQIKNNDGEANAIVEVIRFFTMRSEFTLYTIMNILNEKLFLRPNAEWAADTIKQLQDEIIKTLGNDGVLLFPSEPYPA
ncbi:amidase, partial [Oryctes borbonicus]